MKRVIGLTKRRRRKLREKPFPPAWRSVLERRMPTYRCLSQPDKRELQGHVQVLVREKYFEGCAGLVVTEEMKVLIAAQAALLLLHRAEHYFPWMKTILVYPDSYVGDIKSVGPGGVVTEGAAWRSGESWYTPGSGGPVIVSWSDTVAGAANPADGRNLVIHEFAHQLDADNGAVDGIPALSPAEIPRWKSIMAREQHRLAVDFHRGVPTVINPYGLQNQAEFFAVAVEAFFERATDLKSHHPELYELLRHHFQQDPASRACRASSAA